MIRKQVKLGTVDGKYDAIETSIYFLGILIYRELRHN